MPLESHGDQTKNVHKAEEVSPVFESSFARDSVLDDSSRDQNNNADVIASKNTNAWDRMARAGHILATPVTDEELNHPLRVIDDVGWLGGDIRGWKVLCLAAAGGRHGPLYTAAGAIVTVVDLSPGMLELDREVANQRRMDIRLIESDMCELRSLQNGEFDLVVHPVSSCYTARPGAVFQEVSRVLRGGGLYISQHKQPMNLQASLTPVVGNYVIERPATTGGVAKPPAMASRLRETGATEIIHSLQSIIGGICRAGFVIEDFVEPDHAKPDQPLGSFGHRCTFIPPYIRLKARRRQLTGTNLAVHLPRIWVG
jgi:SAM-dependent methyltransferase